MLLMPFRNSNRHTAHRVPLLALACCGMLLHLLHPRAAAAQEGHELAAKNEGETEYASITVLADSSLSLPLIALGRDYTRTTARAVTLLFGAETERTGIIAKGEPADLIITPFSHELDRMKTEGVIDVYSLTELCRNRLVLAGGASAANDVSQAALSDGDTARQFFSALPMETQIALPDPQKMSSGAFAVETLNALRIMKEIEPRMAMVRDPAALAAILSDGGALGLMYASDAAQYPSIRVLQEVAEPLHAPIIYQGAVIAGEHMEAARNFLEFLKTRSSRDALRRHGCVDLEPPSITQAPPVETKTNDEKRVIAP